MRVWKVNKTIGFFFLKDVFWILRFEKFEFLDEPVINLLQTIYSDHHEWYSLPSNEEEEEDEGEEFGAHDEEAKMFLEELDCENDSPNSIGSPGKWQSFKLDKLVETNAKLSGMINKNKNIDMFASQSNLKKNSNEHLSEIYNKDDKNKEVISKALEVTNESQDETSQNDKLFQFRFEDSDPGINIDKPEYCEIEKLSKRMRALSSTSVTNDLVSKKIFHKTKDIYGINRIGLFLQEWTFKNCIEKLMSVHYLLS